MRNCLHYVSNHSLRNVSANYLRTCPWLPGSFSALFLVTGYGHLSNRKQMDSSKIIALSLQKTKNKETISTKNNNANTLIINVLARIIKYNS